MILVLISVFIGILFFMYLTVFSTEGVPHKIQHKSELAEFLKIAWGMGASAFVTFLVTLYPLIDGWGIFLAYVLSMMVLMVLRVIYYHNYITHQQIQEGLLLYSSAKPLPTFELPQELSQPLNNLILETS